MLTIIKKYSEDAYFRKEDLAKELDHYIVDTVWSEIERYREQFRMDVSFCEQRHFVVLNRKVLFELMKTQQMWYTYQQRLQESSDESKLIEDERQGKWSLLRHQRMGVTPCNRMAWYQDALHLLNCGEAIDYAFLQFLTSEDTPLLLRLFLCRIYLEESIYTVMSRLLMMEYGEQMGSLFAMLEEDKRGKIVIIDADISYYLLQYLRDIRLKISDIMVLLTSSFEEDQQRLPVEELLARYPQLSSDQIQFYARHRKRAHYYTIANYMEDCQSCYETARYSMDKLVSEHWYQKQKLGKKFVYFIV